MCKWIFLFCLFSGYEDGKIDEVFEVCTKQLKYIDMILGFFLKKSARNYIKGLKNLTETCEQ